MNKLPLELLDYIFDLVNIRKLVQISFRGYKDSDYKNSECIKDFPLVNLNKKRIEKYWKKEAKKVSAEYQTTPRYYFGTWNSEIRQRWKNIGLNQKKLASIVCVCFIGNIRILKSMLMIYTCINYGNIPIMIASQCGHLKIVKYLVRILHVEPTHDCIIGAKINGHEHVVEYLLNLIPKKDIQNRFKIEKILEGI
jgi:hypothetical protein